MTEHNGAEFGPPQPPDDLESQVSDNFDRAESGEASPEMRHASEEFTQNLRQILDAREKAAAAMFTRGDVALATSKAQQHAAAYSRCEELETRVIEQSMYYATEVADPRVGYEELNWEFDRTQEIGMYILAGQQELVRDEHFLIDGKVFLRSLTYSVGDGWIFQDIELEDEKTPDGEIRLDEVAETPAHLPLD